MRTVKESIEQTIIEAQNIEDLSFQDDSLHDQSDSQSFRGSAATSVQVKRIQQRLNYCKNALRILQSDI